MYKQFLDFLNSNCFSSMFGTFMGAFLSLIFTFKLNKFSKKMELRVTVWNIISTYLTKMGNRAEDFRNEIRLANSALELIEPYQKFIIDIGVDAYKVVAIINNYILVFPQLNQYSEFTKYLMEAVKRNYNTKEEFTEELDYLVNFHVRLSLEIQKYLLNDFWGRKQMKILKENGKDIGEISCQHK